MQSENKENDQIIKEDIKREDNLHDIDEVILEIQKKFHEL
jgi:hypothetical protein